MQTAARAYAAPVGSIVGGHQTDLAVKPRARFRARLAVATAISTRKSVKARKDLVAAAVETLAIHRLERGMFSRHSAAVQAVTNCRR